MKILFLAIDGVMVNHRSWYVRQKGCPASADPPCVEALNRIIRETGARLVLSSTWRKGTRRRDLVKLLRDWGIEGKLIGETPVLDGKIRGIYVGRTRGQEIAAWLRGAPEVTSFVILDDDADMGKLLPRLVKTSFDAGLTEADADRAIALLREPAGGAANGNKFDGVV